MLFATPTHHTLRAGLARITPILSLVACLLSSAGCLAVDADSDADGPLGEPAAAPLVTDPLVVRQGPFEPRYLLTGELRAAEAQYLTVPRSSSWQVQVRWMEEDGAEVEAGQTVFELDNSEVVTDLEEKRLEMSEKEDQLERTRAEADSAVAEKRFALEQKRAELEKAEIEAAVPRELLPARDWEERRMALRRARVEVEKAGEDLAATEGAQARDVDLARLDLEEARREILDAERDIDALSLEAPVDGILVVEEHPWENRKVRTGDSVFAGMTVMHIPVLKSMQVEAVLYDVDEGRIVPGMAAVATPDTFPDLELAGRVVEVAPVAREVEGSSLRRYFRVRVALDDEVPERLRPGMSVKVEIRGKGGREHLLAPRRALDLGTDPPRAYLAGGGQRDVTLGPCSPSACVVLEGLTAGERLRPRRRGRPEGPS